MGNRVRKANCEILCISRLRQLNCSNKGLSKSQQYYKLSSLLHYISLVGICSSAPWLLCSGVRLKRQLQSWLSSVLAKGKKIWQNCSMVFIVSAWLWLMLLLFTFHWPKQVTWSCPTIYLSYCFFLEGKDFILFIFFAQCLANGRNLIDAFNFIFLLTILLHKYCMIKVSIKTTQSQIKWNMKVPLLRMFQE